MTETKLGEPEDGQDPAIGRGCFAAFAGTRVFGGVRFGYFAQDASGVMDLHGEDDVVELDLDGVPALLSVGGVSRQRWRDSLSRGAEYRVPDGEVCHLVAWQRTLRVDANVASRVSFLGPHVVLREVFDGLSVVDDRSGQVICEVAQAQPRSGPRVTRLNAGMQLSARPGSSRVEYVRLSWGQRGVVRRLLMRPTEGWEVVQVTTHDEDPSGDTACLVSPVPAFALDPTVVDAPPLLPTCKALTLALRRQDGVANAIHCIAAVDVRAPWFVVRFALDGIVSPWLEATT